MVPMQLVKQENDGNVVFVEVVKVLALNAVILIVKRNFMLLVQKKVGII